MTMETILLFILILFVVGTLPAWPYSNSWGYEPMGVLSVILAVFLIWAVVADRPLFKGSGGSIDTAIRDAGQEVKSTGRDVADSFRDAVN